MANLRAPNIDTPLTDAAGRTTLAWWRFWHLVEALLAGIVASPVLFADLTAAPDGVTRFCSDAKNILDDGAAAGSIAVADGQGSLLARINGTWRITA